MTISINIHGVRDVEHVESPNGAHCWTTFRTADGNDVAFHFENIAKRDWFWQGVADGADIDAITDSVDPEISDGA